MPPVFGPASPSNTALWSCVGASGSTSRPSHSAMKLTSSPRQKLLNHQPALQRVERRFRLGAVVRDHHALAGRQAVGLQDHREAEPVEGAPGVGLRSPQ